MMAPTAVNKPVLLSSVLQGIYPLHTRADRELQDITLDSRCVQVGSLFMACKGASFDGRHYIDKAINAGAAAVLVEADEVDWCCEQERDGVPVLPVLNLQQQMAELASRFYGEPGKQLRLIGITGTNGKTTTCQLLAQTLQALGYCCGVIGTLGHGLVGSELSSEKAGPGTTPDAVKLQQIFAGMRAQSADTVVMEVSSHALDQRRILVDDFAVGIFTNLTRDHLDYHGTMDAYGATKQTLFHSRGLELAVLNADDEFVLGTRTALSGDVRCFTWSTHNSSADVYTTDVQFLPTGLQLVVCTPWGKFSFYSALLGSFNVSNLLAVLTTALAAEALKPGFDAARIVSAVANLKTVVGRMQPVGNFPVTAVVDYAHTPDALEKALQAVREHCSGRLWCVFGCGGDRDRGKRPQMAAVAERLADQLVMTNDNPRTESAASILADMQAGLQHPARSLVIADRAVALATALNDALPGDVVLIAGKGHEDYQEVAGQRLPFSDALIAHQCLLQRFGAETGRASA
ncbi:MAG: UDP-N-acetylmuramoyl-L-alanyl-D-glutamate--2,6-diaminopimelate ligase [Pseudomonadota bacterium]